MKELSKLKARAESSKKGAVIKTRLSAPVIQQLMDIKAELDKSTGGASTINSVIERAIHSFHQELVQAELWAEQAVSLHKEEETEEIPERDMYQETEQALSDLVEYGPDAVTDYEDFVPGGIDLGIHADLRTDLSEVLVPGIMVVTAEGEPVVLVGSESVSASVAFCTRAIKRGEANQGKTDEDLDRRYKEKSRIFKVYRDLSSRPGIEYKLVSLEAPKSVKGRAVALQIIKQHPEILHDPSDFYRTPKKQS